MLSTLAKNQKLLITNIKTINVNFIRDINIRIYIDLYENNNKVNQKLFLYLDKRRYEGKTLLISLFFLSFCVCLILNRKKENNNLIHHFTRHMCNVKLEKKKTSLKLYKQIIPFYQCHKTESILLRIIISFLSTRRIWQKKNSYIRFFSFVGNDFHNFCAKMQNSDV